MPYRRMTLLELSTNMMGRKGNSLVDPMPSAIVETCGAITKTWTVCRTVLTSSGVCANAGLHANLSMYPDQHDTSMNAIRRWAEIASYHGIPEESSSEHIAATLRHLGHNISANVAQCVAQHRKELNRG